MDLTYRDIVRTLAVSHGIILSVRQLKRDLKRMGLFRRKNYSDIADIIEFISDQLRTSGKLHGYRWMWEKCRLYNMRCRKEEIRYILGVLDPEGTDLRRRRRLLRRTYHAKGPNFLWHLDSYDKLKRYGICINGCVDGFSRRIVWMNAYNTSSDPRLIGGYFMECIDSLGGCPTAVRGDFGTENTYVRDIQRYLRADDYGEIPENCYLEGASTANQRVEYMWSFLRRECTDFWILLFRDLLNDGYFNGTFLDFNLVQFCFMSIIQDDLDDVLNTWNRHLICPSKNACVPSGRPNVMYFMPELYDTRSYLCNITQVEINACKEKCRYRRAVPCDEDVHELCCLIMAENGLAFPNDPESAVHAYKELRQAITVNLV